MIFPPPKLHDLPIGTELVAGQSHSTILADIDFETYSPAGFVFNTGNQVYRPPKGAAVKGLQTVGVTVYTEHPESEVLSCAYNLKDGKGAHLWKPGDTPPADLFEHVASGGLLEAWNSFFEFMVWNNICTRLYNWPPLPLEQLRCASAKARAFALPKSLDLAGQVMQITHQKDKDGKRLLNKFSIPRNPTKTNKARRIYPVDDTQDAERLYAYNIRDIEAEAEISSLVPDLNEFELEFWLCDQRINARGVAIDIKAIEDCIKILEQIYYENERKILQITQGAVQNASQVARIIKWLHHKGVHTDTLDAEALERLLKQNLEPDVIEVLKIREQVSSAAVKKLYAMLNRSSKKGRLHDLFIYHSARTGRAAGAGVQPQNFPNSGDDVAICDNPICHRHFAKKFSDCSWCGTPVTFSPKEWNKHAVNDALEIIASRNARCVEYYFGNAVSTISGCLRGMFIASPGHDLICSDYSAIEAVVLAALSGEQWRLDVFNTHGRIYETSGSKIGNVPFETLIEYKKSTGQHHPLRKLGKTAELASGYQGWLGAWKAFGADEFMSEEEIKQAILAWRAASPMIVEMWGGQPSWKRDEYYGLEGMAILAVMNPGVTYDFRGIRYVMKQNVLYCRLLSGRYLVYHKPCLQINHERNDTYQLSFEGYNSNPNAGAMGWIRMTTYGGKLTENVVQATARDILAEAIVKLEKRGYPIVLHVHDEIVAEVPENFGSIEEFESIMSQPPAWAYNWPIKASGGWRDKRYGK